MKVFVTGGSGFIGTNIIADLLQRGHKVQNFDIRQSATYPELTRIGDVRDMDKLASSMGDVQAVFHLAAEHRDDVKPVDLYFDVNVRGAQNVVTAAMKGNVKTIVFTSTVALYGLNVGTPNEDSRPHPFNAYGDSKLEAETIFRKWIEGSSGRTLVIVRPSVIFGEHNRGNVFHLIEQISAGKFFMVGDGSNRKSMGYVRNISKFLAGCLELQGGNYIFNYADKPDLTTKELVSTIRSALGKNSRAMQIPYSVGMLGGWVFDLLAAFTGRAFPISSIRVKKFCSDTTIAAEKIYATGFQPDYTLEEGLRRTIEHEFGCSRGTSP